MMQKRKRRKRGDSPISLRLEKPAVMGACLGDLPRFGALDDQTLHPSPSDFSLYTQTHIHTHNHRKSRQVIYFK